ncbi:MAG TPA: hypothetical protein VLA48_03535 [Nitrososphaeraceae archaeon]|nr:hypothetical protein [Nitrososphaeraceae archaeon]
MEIELVKPRWKAKIGQKVYYKNYNGEPKSGIVVDLKEVYNNLCRRETHLEIFIGDYSNHTKTLGSDEWFVLKENNNDLNIQEIHDFESKYKNIINKYSEKEREQMSVDDKEKLDEWFSNLSIMEQQRVNNICSGRSINDGVYTGIVGRKNRL